LGPEWNVIGTKHSVSTGNFRRLDVCLPQQIRECLTETRPEVVIYAAGLTSVDECEDLPHQADLVNRAGVAEITRNTTARIIYVSTDYVFDGVEGTYTESAIPKPLSVYGRSKAAGEQAVLAAGSTNIVLRVSGLFTALGTRQGAFDRIRDGMRHDDDDRLSSPTNVDDVRNALKMLLNHTEGGVFHAAGPHELSRYEFQQIVFAHGASREASRPSFHHRNSGNSVGPFNSSLLSLRLGAMQWKPRRCADCFGGGATFLGDSLNWGVVLADIDVVIVDCVGAALGRRKWLPHHVAYDATDADCQDVIDGEAFWINASERLKIAPEQLQNAIASRYAPNPDLWRVLPTLQSRFRLALTNNGPAATFRQWVNKYGFDRIFQVLANSEELGARKPDPRFYRTITKQLAVRPERCLVLDDSEQYLQGASACGMRTVRMIPYEDPVMVRYRFELPAARSARKGMGHADS
jgi:dTDP-4-dehydrorhamnose reductase